VEQLRDLYSAENQLVKALSKMAKAASHAQLQSAFTEHLAQTQQHVQRLDQIFKQLDTSSKGSACQGMEGLISEGERHLQRRQKISSDLTKASI
jgi:ferritin-like metal-binding protein YciE